MTRTVQSVDCDWMSNIQFVLNSPWLHKMMNCKSISIYRVNNGKGSEPEDNGGDAGVNGGGIVVAGG